MPRCGTLFAMYVITVSLQYPASPEIPEDEEVSFVLSGEYPCNSPQEARGVVLRLIAMGGRAGSREERPGWVLDADGIPWPFYPETVRDVKAEEAGEGEHG